MADDYEIDDGMDFDDAWLYVEEDLPLSDELAETQIADPGYAGTQNEIEMEEYEYDLYNYWDDLDYADDAYWEYDGIGRLTQPDEKPGQKRKRAAVAKSSTSDKKRKISKAQATRGGVREVIAMENVVFMSWEERLRMFAQPPPLLNKKKAKVAFLADWRERFAGLDGEVKGEMPEEMVKAAFAADEENEPQIMEDGGEGDGEEEGDWEDEAEGVEAGDLAALDPDMLKAILKQKLGEAGLEGMDEGAFMATLSKMLAGDEDEAAGDLANQLLGQENGALTGWLAGQGVSLNDEEADEDGDLPEAPSESAGKLEMLSSPPDSAVSLAQEGSSQPTELAMHPSSPQSRQGAASSTRRQGRKGKEVAERDAAELSSMSKAADHASSTSNKKTSASSKADARDISAGIPHSEGPARPSRKRKAEVDGAEMTGRRTRRQVHDV